jgi:hypothetical protein
MLRVNSFSLFSKAANTFFEMKMGEWGSGILCITISVNVDVAIGVAFVESIDEKNQ